MSGLILTDEFTTKYTPMETITTAFKNYTLPKMAVMYNTTEDLMTRFYTYAEACIEKEHQRFAELNNPLIQTWQYINFSW